MVDDVTEVSIALAETTGAVTSTGSMLTGGYVTPLTPSQVVVMNQANWFISFANGSDGNDGLTAASALKTPAEFARRTQGLIPTPPSVVVTILDVDLVNPPVIRPGYAGIAKGTILTVQGAHLTPQNTTVGAWRAENPATNTPRAITQAAVAWSSPGPLRGVFTSGPDSGTSFWSVANEGAGVGQISAPTNAAGAVAGNAAPGNAITMYTVPVVSDVQFDGFIDGDLSTGAQILFKDLDISASGDAAFTSINWSGGGLVTFFMCGVGFYLQGSQLQPQFINCRIDGFQSNGGQVAHETVVYSGILGGPIFQNSNALLSNVWTNSLITAQGSTIDIVSPLSGTTAVAGFGIASDGIFELNDGSVLRDNAHVIYGTGNSFTIVVNTGSEYEYSNQSPATNTRGDFAFDGNIRAWASMPYTDKGTLSRACVTTAVTVNGVLGGGIGGKTAYGQVTADQAALAANAFTDIPGATTTVVNAGTCAYDVDLRVCGTGSGATTGIVFRILVDGAVPLGGVCEIPSAVAAGAQSTGARVRVPLAAGTHTIKAQYNAGAGASLAIRPNTQSESCSISSMPGVPGT